MMNVLEPHVCYPRCVIENHRCIHKIDLIPISMENDCKLQFVISLVITEPTDTVTSVQINKTEIGVGSADGFVYRFDVVAGKVRRDFVASEICSFWLGEGCVLIQSQDGALRLIDGYGGGLLGTYEGHKGPFLKIIFLNLE